MTDTSSFLFCLTVGLGENFLLKLPIIFAGICCFQSAQFASLHS